MNLAYTPINIYCPIPDQALLLEWFHTHKLLDTDYWEYTEDRHVWAKVVTDTLRVDKQKSPAICLILDGKTRLAIIEWSEFERLVENDNDS